jgi:hypothetical protein
MKIIDYSVILYTVLFFIRAWLYYSQKIEKVAFLTYCRRLIELKLEVLACLFDLRLRINNNHYNIVNILTLLIYAFIMFFIVFVLLIN